MDPLIDRAALGVTELLSNVHRHAQPDKTCTVEIELRLDRLTVSVHDHDPRLPVVEVADPLATCGRGLAMVAAVSDSWGARPDGDDGKVVWFSLPTPAAARAGTARPARRTAADRSVPGFTEVERVALTPEPVTLTAEPVALTPEPAARTAAPVPLTPEPVALTAVSVPSAAEAVTGTAARTATPEPVTLTAEPVGLSGEAVGLTADTPRPAHAPARSAVVG